MRCTANILAFPAGPHSCGANVVAFPARSRRPRRDQRGLMDAVYAAGSLPVAAEDRMTKVLASKLQIYGFVAVDEVCTDGTLRRLRPSETINATPDRPWRLSRTVTAWGGGAEPLPA